MVMLPQGVGQGMTITVDVYGQVMPLQQPMGMQQPMQPMVDAWQIIDQMPNCELQEEIRWGEVLTQFIGVEIDFANKYKVVDPNGVEVLLFAEETDFCTRQMKRGSCADCVGWHVRGLNIYGGARVPFLNMQRDFTCTFCCFNRPQ